MTSSVSGVTTALTDLPRVIVFHRNFQRFTGGHLKVFHYFLHARSCARYDARLRLTADSAWNETNPWFAYPDAVLRDGMGPAADVDFVAGHDWRALDGRPEPSATPVFSLIQGFLPLHRDSPMRPDLARRAVRICVTPELQEALEAMPDVRGPVFTVPIGVDLAGLPARPREDRELDCVVLAVKDLALGPRVARRIEKRGHRVLLVDRPLPREALLDAIGRARVAVLLPWPVEGAYLPPLEAMAMSTAVVCPDCVGNRSFCRDGETAFVPRRRERAIARAALDALGAGEDELSAMLERARGESEAHSLAVERQGFLELLARADELWEA